MNKKKPTPTILISIGILIFSQLIAYEIGEWLGTFGIPILLWHLIAALLYIGIAYSLIYLLCKKYLHTTMKNVFIPSFKIDIKWLIIALLLPLTITAIYLLLFKGTLVAVKMTNATKITSVSFGILFTGLGAGIVEEIIFRGVIMNTLKESHGIRFAVIVPSLIFGAIHVLGMEFNIINWLLVLASGTAVGIMFSLIALDQHSIWNSAIVHALWNSIIIGGYLWIGSTSYDYAIYNYVLQSNSFLLTGGEFGIEASLISVIGYLIVCFIAYHSIKKASPQ